MVIEAGDSAASCQQPMDETAGLALILESVDVAVITINSRGIIQASNRALTTLFGYARNQVIGQNVKMLMPRSYQIEHDGHIQRHLQTGENRIIGLGRQVTGQRSDGSTFPMHLSVGKHTQAGEILFTGIIQDLSIQEKNLENSARLGRIFDQSINEVYVFNSSSLKFSMVNRGALANLGYTLDQMRTMTPLDIKPDLNRESFGRLISPLLTGKRDRVRFQTRHQRKDGTSYDVEVVLNLSDAVFPPEFVAIIQDVTEQHKLMKAFQQSQKLEAIGQLTGGLAHDFNNLLTVISGNLELLEMNLSNENNRELLQEARDASAMGARLTNRLLAFARRSSLSPTLTNLNNLVLSLAEMMRRTIGEHITLNIKLSPELWLTQVDISQLENALVNLAINARDAMPNGGNLDIDSCNRRLSEDQQYELDIEPGDYVCISVADNGTGIEPENLPKIFEPFFTTKSDQRGSGLGLSIVYGFARQSGGAVEVSSETGVGTRFSLYLPRAEGVVPDSRTDLDIPARKYLSSKKILVVEDETSVRKLTTRRLRNMGHDVVEAGNGPEALAQFTGHNNIELVFTDVIMTDGMTGFELAEKIRERDAQVRILLTSGYAEDHLDSDRLQSSGLHLLKKPYTNAELEQAVFDEFAGSA